MGKDKKAGLGTLKEVGGTSRVHAEVLSILMVLLNLFSWEAIHIRHMSFDSDNHDMLSFYPKDMVIIYHSKSGYVVENADILMMKSTIYKPPAFMEQPNSPECNILLLVILKCSLNKYCKLRLREEIIVF